MRQWVDVDKASDAISGVFNSMENAISHFGSTVNQVFEAFTFCSVLKWYEDRGWTVKVVNPVDLKTKRPVQFVKLKFSTRGRPDGYSYAICENDAGDAVQVRHQLRVSTKFDRGRYPPANICLDVAVIRPINGIEYFSTDDAIPNESLVSFGEAKHMSAYAELVAAFLGMVHELQPSRLRRVRRGAWDEDHVAPFLYVSGHLYTTAKGLVESILRRKYDVDVYWDTRSLATGLGVPKKKAGAPSSTGRVRS
jgi:hypothetical protein